MVLVEMLKALSDDNRLKIVKMLSCGDMCVCDICENLELSQPAVSHHLKILSDAGLLNTKRDGKWIYYSINKEGFSSLNVQMKELVQKRDDCNFMKTDCGNCEKE
jgi:ArsR family transcriptional regulator, arsenate/arsenite/antimonite-responsive transcriptional repressor